MKLFLVVLALVSGYLYMTLYTTTLVLGQTSQLNQTYQSIAAQSQIITGGQ